MRDVSSFHRPPLSHSHPPSLQPPLLLSLDGWWVELPHSDAASLHTLISRSLGLSDTINPFCTSTNGSHIQMHAARLGLLMSHSHAQRIDYCPSTITGQYFLGELNCSHSVDLQHWITASVLINKLSCYKLEIEFKLTVLLCSSK